MLALLACILFIAAAISHGFDTSAWVAWTLLALAAYMLHHAIGWPTPWHHKPPQ